MHMSKIIRAFRMRGVSVLVDRGDHVVVLVSLGVVVVDAAKAKPMAMGVCIISIHVIARIIS